MTKNIVFRALNEEQAIAAEKGEPIYARKPDGDISIAWHVRGKELEKSQHISTTKDFHCLLTKDSGIQRDARTTGSAIIAIDLDAVIAKGIIAIDLTEDDTLDAAGFSKREHARNWAKSSKEVIIERVIPSDCYILIVPAGMIQQIDLFMKLNWTEKYGDQAQQKIRPKRRPFSEVLLTSWTCNWITACSNRQSTEFLLFLNWFGQ